jgi:hypothetical protein
MAVASRRVLREPGVPLTTEEHPDQLGRSGNLARAETGGGGRGGGCGIRLPGRERAVLQPSGNGGAGRPDALGVADSERLVDFDKLGGIRGHAGHRGVG